MSAGRNNEAREPPGVGFLAVIHAADLCRSSGEIPRSSTPPAVPKSGTAAGDPTKPTRLLRALAASCGALAFVALPFCFGLHGENTDDLPTCVPSAPSSARLLRVSDRLAAFDERMANPADFQPARVASPDTDFHPD